MDMSSGYESLVSNKTQIKGFNSSFKYEPVQPIASSHVGWDFRPYGPPVNTSKNYNRRAPVVQASAASEDSPKPKQRERTYIMIKPDGVQRGLVGEVI